MMRRSNYLDDAVKQSLLLLTTIVWVSNAVSTTSAVPPTSTACLYANLYPGTVSGLADEVSSVKDDVTCEVTCNADSTCKSYQINTNSGQTLCWIQRQSNPFTTDNLYPQSGVTEFVKVNCTCVVFVNLYPGRASGLADEVSSAKDSATCRATCLSDLTCESYQINTNSGQTLCWIQRQQNPFTSDNLYPQSGVTEFVKTDCSSAISSTSVPVSSTTMSLSSSSVPISSTSTTTSRTSFPSSSTSFPISSSTFISPTSPTCVAFVNLYPGRVSGLADEVSSVKDNATCEATCRADPRCESYQINTNSGQTLCWIQRQPNPFTNDNLYPQSGVIEFVKTNCSSTFSTTSFPASSTSMPTSSTSFPVSSSSTSLPTVISSTTIPTSSTSRTVSSTSFTVTSTSTSPTSFLCVAFANLYPGSQTGGATPLNNVRDNATCEATCRTDPACLSYQINTNRDQTLCWVQRQPNAFDQSNIYNQPNVVEFVKINCTNVSSSTSTLTSSTSTRSSIAPSPTSLTTVSSTTSTSRSSVSTTTRTTRPITSTTAPTCSYNFTVTNNMNMRGGTETRWVTLDECQQACLANLQCIAIDVNTNPGQIYCYLIFNAVQLTSYPGVNHYDLYRGNNCPTPSTVTVPSTTTPGTPTCLYKKLEGANANGGSPVANNIDENQCLQLCNLNPVCISFEYSFQTKTCFIHTANDDSQNNLCCNRYILQCSTSPCTDDFLLQSGYSPTTLQGYPQSGVTSVDQCKLACLSNPNCTRFFYIAQNPRTQVYCYLYYIATDPVSPVQGVDLYIRERCLYNVSITVATTTTTPVPTPPPGSCLIDLQFVVDSSGSIREATLPGVDNWELMKMFMKSLINSSIHYGVNFDHVGIVQFSDYARVVFDFQNSVTTPFSGLIAAIDNMPYLGAQTNTGEGLRLGIEMFANSSRPNALHVMVLLTDGRVTAQWKDGFWTQVVKLNQTNIIRYAIGVTSNVSKEELYAVALYSNAVEYADSYEDLPGDVMRASLFINSFSCQGIKPTTAFTSTSLSSTSSTASTRTSTSSTTTSTSTTRTTTTTTTTTPTPTTTTTTISTTTFARNLGAEGLFGAYKNSSSTGVNTTDFSGVLANRFNLFNIALDQFDPVIRANEYFYTEICAGIPQSTMCLLQTVGAYPPLTFDWLSTAQNDIDSGCRGGVLAVAIGSSTSLTQTQTGGGLYSNEQRLTSWSMFSITDTMRYNSSLLSVYSNNPSSNPGKFQFASPYVNPTSPWQLYNAATTEYGCIPPVVGYFFSMSVGIAAGLTASVVLSVDGVNYEMIRLGNTTTGTTTLARSVFAPCSTSALMTLSSGSVVPGNFLISFTAFPYERSFGSNSVSWAAYRTTNFTASNPLSFDYWTVQQSAIQTNNILTIPTTGYYYVYISTGIHAQSTVNVNLLRNGQILFGLRRRATNYNGVDTIGHGFVVLLSQNDVLQVQSLETGYSSAAGRHASFFGMLLYDS